MIAQMKQSFKQLKIPTFEINPSDFITIDRAIQDACKVLKKKYAKGIERVWVNDAWRSIVSCFQIIGILTNTLIYFFLVMEAKEWNYKIIIQILIYSGLLIAVLLQYLLVFLAFLYCLAEIEKSSETEGSVFTGIVLGPSVASLIVIALAIWKYTVLLKEDPSASHVFAIHFCVYVTISETE